MSFLRISILTFAILIAVSCFSLFFKPTNTDVLFDLGYEKASLAKSIQNENINEKGPYLIHFWSIKCPPCKKEMPGLVKFAKSFKYSVIFVSTNTKDEVDNFLKTENFDNIKNICDRSMIFSLAVHSVPTTVLMNKNNQEIGRFEGAIDWNHFGLENALLKALEE